MLFFGQKLLNTQHSVGSCARKSPIVKWANVSKVFPKNALKPNTASHNNASWYIDTDWILEHSPSGGSLYCKGPTLQKISPVLGWSCHICMFFSKLLSRKAGAKQANYPS